VEIILAIIIIAAVFLFLGLCILVHEFGHLLVALWRGLHVERFSIGFGKKLWGFERKGVEYRVSMLPFGGYVALPQLEPTKTPTTEDGTPLPQAKPFDRILTALAGPVANILFGFLLGAVVWFVGVQRPETLSSFEVYSVEEDSPEYEAGLRPGDHILQVNGETVEGSWEGLMQDIALSKGQVELLLERGETKQKIAYMPAENPEFEGLGFPFFEVKTPVEILHVNPQSPADLAGLQKGDRILAVNGEPVQNTISFLLDMWNSKGEPVDITVRRGDQELVVSGIRGKETVLEGKVRYLIGVLPGEPMVMKHLSPWWQFKNVLRTTGNTLGALFSSKSLVKPKHMSGPVGIIQMNYLTVRHRGWRQGLFFVVFVSFSLAIFNLLPFPVLDGGHIVFGLFEGLTPWRVPERVAYYIQATFAVALITLMLYVTFFDVRRLTRGLFDGGEDNAAPPERTEEPASPPPASPN
jgi:regulator of sigma E protease